eukprot:TRINITY_DN11030_c0_g3_i1.p1 TRINITY_DN11030_c0_g3~~TRINITY_DN11030_c0_g3_i1.p1  ORF type:complete len:299 (+),score=21.91 TRINITY_DN11030_c0_g3_i1:467-1363(+)
MMSKRPSGCEVELEDHQTQSHASTGKIAPRPHGRTQRRLEQKRKRSGQADEAQPQKEKRTAAITAIQGSGNPFLRSWVWKREGKSDRERFERPYTHEVAVGGRKCTLIIHQARFKEAGFASTVWDSSIVLAKYLERWPHFVEGKRSLELGAGCGLVGIVAACLGTRSSVLTDQAGNLPLLEKNVRQNQPHYSGGAANVSVKELSWGSSSAEAFSPPLDVLLATDVVYHHEAVAPLVETLRALVGPNTTVFLAHGRNRTAEEAFFEKVRKWFRWQAVERRDWHPEYTCEDVDVYEMKIL